MHDDPGALKATNDAIKTAIDTERDAIIAAIDTLPKSHADIVAAIADAGVEGFTQIPTVIAQINAITADDDNAGDAHAANRTNANKIRTGFSRPAEYLRRSRN